MKTEKHYHTPGPVEAGLRAAISSVEEIIEEARAGRMYILVDHEDRENEGDLIIPAQFADAAAINFMAREGRGLVCLCLTADRCERLGLSPMVPTNASRHETAFTASIEAREGIETGISARDRARTVGVAIDPSKGAEDIVSPGHVFPLRARDGGVLVRAGHTEASVDISRLAGVDPSAVICEVMNDDGTMARLPELITFARKHGMKIGTIADLIAYRRRHDNLVRPVADRMVTSVFGGEWRLRIFTDTSANTEHVALTKGDVATTDQVLVRMHSFNLLEDALGLGAARSGEIGRAMSLVAEEGRGVVVLLRDPMVKLASDTPPETKTLRHYGIGAQILAALGVHRMVLLTDNPAPKVIGLDAYGLSIEGTRPIAAK